MDFKQMNLMDWLKLCFIVLLIIGIGMFTVNQTMGYFYKSQFLQAPCALCVKINPHLEDCIREHRSVRSGPEYEMNLSVEDLEGLFKP